MTRYILLLFIPMAFLLGFGCKSGDITYHDLNGARLDGIGEIDDVVVIADNTLWETAVKDTFMYYFTSPYLLLPQPEPIFKVKHFTVPELHDKPLRKGFKTMVFLANMGAQNSETSKMTIQDIGEEKINTILKNKDAGFAIAKNKWTEKDQMIIYLVGDSQEGLMKAIVDNFPGIAAKIRQHDAPRIKKRVYFDGKNKRANLAIKDSFNFHIDIPIDYVISGVKNEDFVWLRKETTQISSNILIAKKPYLNESQLHPDTVQAYLNQLGKKYVASTVEGSYWVTNDQDLPVIPDNITLNGQFATELRGIWELENDYMGGPFICYATINPATNELVLMAGFAYAPEKKKKRLLQDLEGILRTADFGVTH